MRNKVSLPILDATNCRLDDNSVQHHSASKDALSKLYRGWKDPWLIEPGYGSDKPMDDDSSEG
jgi:hypothetical protein